MVKIIGKFNPAKKSIIIIPNPIKNKRKEVKRIINK